MRAFHVLGRFSAFPIALLLLAGAASASLPGPAGEPLSDVKMEMFGREGVSASPQAPAGETWRGSLGGIEFFVTFVPAADGEGVTATLDIPAQGLNDYPVTDVVYTDTEIAFTLPIAPPSGATWRATRDAGASSASGVLEQGTASVPFSIEMLADADFATEPSRPQTPVAPFPYSEVEVTFTNLADDVVLAGTLMVPPGPGPFPAAVLVTGSGPQYRNEEVFGHRPYGVLGDHLARNGIAVLRFDDRGVGASGGDFSVATTEDFAGDALAGVRFLLGRADVRADAVGIIGHSEGGIVAAMVAADNDEVGFVVLLAGSAVPGLDLMIMQLEAVQRAAGRPEDNIAQQLEVQEDLMELVLQGAALPQLTEAIAALTRIQLAALPEAQRPGNEQMDATVESLATQLMAPWWRFFLTFDPRTALRRVHCPVLALNGALDTQVPAAANLGAIRGALEEAGNADVTIEEFAELNHMFQTAQTGSPAEYPNLEETFAPAAMERVSAWINARFAAARE